jgi:alkaline phosphatase D
VSRRELLAGLAAVAFGPSLLACASHDELAPPLALTGPFPLGVASGEATADGVVLWSLQPASPLPLEVRVWDNATGEGAPVHAGPVAQGAHGVLRAELTGLRPGTRHSYRFVELGGAESPLGRFRTALNPEALVPVTFGATSCTHYKHDTATLRHAAGREDLDLFLWLGDISYNDHARDLPEFRASWARTLSDPGQQQVRAAHAVLGTWDDHEFTNDAHAQMGTAEWRAAAQDSFFEHMPMRRIGTGTGRLWRSVRWGRTAEFFLLDCRSERLPSTRLTPGAQYLSPEQLAWLQDGLLKSQAVFKVVLNSVPITAFPGAMFGATVEDRWQGFPAQREALLRFIDEHAIPGVLWLSGDFHLASCGRVSGSGPGARAVEVLVGPGAQNPNPSPTYPAGPQFDWASGVNNYAVIALEPATGEAHVRHVSGTGALLSDRRYTLAPR